MGEGILHLAECLMVFVPSSQMVSTGRWNRSAALTTKPRRTPPPKWRRGGAAHEAWLPVWWVSSTTDPSLIYNMYKYCCAEGRLTFRAPRLSCRTPSRVSQWFCFGISTPSSLLGPSMGEKLLLLVSNRPVWSDKTNSMVVFIFLFHSSWPEWSRCGIWGRTTPHTAMIPSPCRPTHTRVLACACDWVSFVRHWASCSPEICRWPEWAECGFACVAGYSGLVLDSTRSNVMCNCTDDSIYMFNVSGIKTTPGTQGLHYDYTCSPVHHLFSAIAHH